MNTPKLIPWSRPFNISVQQKNRLRNPLFNLQDDMNKLFQKFFSDNIYSTWSEEFSASFPAVDIIENDNDFKIKAEVPGYNPEDIDVSVTDGFLMLKGERKEEEEEKDENYLRREASYGSFQRTITLPETANCEKAEASFKNGMLNIKIPKKAGAVQILKKLPIKKAA